ncbi:MAG: nucleotidyltransferase domain-containing protein [Armatimonadota bacterium]|nr:nucleotidyltransferase domain-containing protein [Armatimonadota bacterium]
MRASRRLAGSAAQAEGHAEALRRIAVRYADALRDLLGPSLVSVVLFGSVARGDARAHSDIDLLVIVSDLPPGRLARQGLVGPADALLDPELERLRRQAILTDVNPILKTPEEVLRLPPLLLDLVEDAVVLHDRDGFFAGVLARLRESLARLGARRVQRGWLRYWELKPDYLPGEVFEL